MKIKVNVMDYGEAEIELPDETIKAIGKVYEQLLEPSVKELGDSLSILPSIANIIAHPIFRKRLENKIELEMLENTYNNLKEGLNKIPTNEYTNPRISMRIAAKSTFFKVFCDENLSNMFIELYKKASHKNYTDIASELFMGILDNMSPQDAVLIKQGKYLEQPRPLIRIFECDVLGEADEDMKNAGMPEFYTAPHKNPVFSHYALTLSDPPENEKGLSISIYNLRRHELINADYIERIIKPGGYKALYEQLINSDFYKSCQESALQRGVNLCLTRGYTSPTDLGRLFFEVCCKSS